MMPTCRDGPSRSAPYRCRRPSDGRSNPLIKRRRVDFPHPEGPTMDTKLAPAIARSIGPNALNSPKYLLTFDSSMRGASFRLCSAVLALSAVGEDCCQAAPTCFIPENPAHILPSGRRLASKDMHLSSLRLCFSRLSRQFLQSCDLAHRLFPAPIPFRPLPPRRLPPCGNYA